MLAFADISGYNKAAWKGRKIMSKVQGTCEMCMYYEYDEDYECYTCQMNLDEDEMARFMMNQVSHCPYFRFGDEYMIVRKQM
jgi:hypothetical protein